jgi:TP901 family phage tail tape measure protein
MAQKFDLLIKAKTAGEAGIKRMGNSMQGLQGRLKNVRMAALSVNTAFRAMAVILTAGALTRVIKGSIDQADAFGKLSRQTGVAADTLQSYVNAGKLAGVEQVAIDKGLSRLAQSIREADQGVNTYTDSFDALGISVRDSQGNLKSTEQVFGEVADRFADMENGGTKAALAMELFSRQGRKLIPLLNEGSSAMNEWNYETSEGFAANAEYFNDQMTMLGFQVDGFRKQLADALLPALNSIAEAFRDVFSAENDWSNFFDFIEGAIRAIAATIFGVMKLFQEVALLGDRVISQIKKMMQAVENATPKWFKKLIGGGAGFAKELGSRFVTQQKKNLRNVLGDDYVDAAKGRFEQNTKSLGKIISGRSEAGEDYYKQGTQKAKELEAQLTRTFGGSMKAKVESYAKTVGDFGSQVGDVVVKAFKGLEDQMVNFVMTGKMAFKDLARSIIADMARIAIRAAIIKPLMGALFPKLEFAKGGVLENGKHITAYSKGGVVTRPTIFPMAKGMGLMSEAGPEAIMPLKRGKGGRLGVEAQGGGGANIVVNVDAQGTSVQGSDQEGRQLGKLIAAAVKGTIIQEQRPGGLLAA